MGLAMAAMGFVCERRKRMKNKDRVKMGWVGYEDAAVRVDLVGSWEEGLGRMGKGENI